MSKGSLSQSGRSRDEVLRGLGYSMIREGGLRMVAGDGAAKAVLLHT